MEQALALATVAAAALAGATIQAAIGFGVNLVFVPVLALVLPHRLPATAVLLAIPLSAIVLRHEHHALDRRGFRWIALGYLPGALVGAAVVVVVPTHALQVLIALAILAAVVASVRAPRIGLTRRTGFAGGVASGVTGTAAGIGGPPLALLYQHHEGSTVRSTLAAASLFGTCVSIVALAVARLVSLADCELALALAPFVLVGTLLGRRAHVLLDRGWLRPAVLTFATISSLGVLVSALA